MTDLQLAKRSMASQLRTFVWSPVIAAEMGGQNFVLGVGS